MTTGALPPLLERVPTPTLADVTVGWSVRERGEEQIEWTRRGGIVVDVERHAEADPETGEFFDRYTTVRCWRGTELVWAVLRADQLAVIDFANKPNAGCIREVVNLAAKQAAKATKADRKLELLSLAVRLWAVVARPLSVPVP